ncbi:MAG: hypothetical protein PHG08_07275 [Bacilli bacterium]|nr:hypothetical protein [Bacilli bacterium]HHU23923.1 hypothetical protein [Acholeplasmataceae bacterium]
MEIRGINEYKQLILKLNSKTEKFEDITKEVLYLNDFEKNWFVIFLRSDGTKAQYRFKLQNIKVSINPINIDIDNWEIYLNGQKTTKIKLIQKFDNLGYKIYFTNSSPLFVNRIFRGESNPLNFYWWYIWNFVLLIIIFDKPLIQLMAQNSSLIN